MASDFIAASSALQVQMVQKFIALLKQGDYENSENFSVAVRHTIKYCGIPVSEFIDEFGVSSGTVSRWARGKSVPYPMARPLIIDWIISRLQQEITSPAHS